MTTTRLARAHSTAQFVFGDHKNVNFDLSKTNRSEQQAIEIISSQYAYSKPADFASYRSGISYLRKPSEYHLPESEYPNIGGDKRMAVGTAKSCAYVEGLDGRGNLQTALVIDGGHV